MKQHALASQLAQVFATVGIAGLALVGCSKPAPQTNPQASSTASTATTASSATTSAAATGIDPNKPEIVIGTTVGDFGDMVTQSVKPQLEKQGYKVKLVEFSDYVRPNQALASGDIDLNVFQHKP